MAHTSITFLKESAGSFKWIMNASQPYLKRILLLSALGSAPALFAIASALISRNLIDSAIQRDMRAIAEYSVMFGGALLTSQLMTALNTYWSSRIAERINLDFQSRLFNRICAIHWKDATRYHSGDLSTRIFSDSKAISAFITGSLPQVISIAIEALVAFVVVFTFDPSLALAVVILAPLAALASILIGRKLRHYQKAIMENESKYRGFVNESLQHLLIIKTFECIGTIRTRLADFNNNRLNLVFEQSTIAFRSSLATGILLRLGFLACFIWGAYRIATGYFSFGTFTAVLQLFNRIQAPFNTLGQLLPKVISALTAAERYRDVDSLPSESESDVVHDPAARIRITAKDLSFSYRPEQPILDRLCFSVSTGETLAVVGPSGAGKTTLFRLLLDLYQPSQGTLEVAEQGGHGSIQMRRLHRGLFSFVPQGNTLFSGTIEENLRIGCPEATPEELRDALRIACADTFVEALPLGIQSEVGELNQGLSEGQVQRLCIARSLLRKAPVLLLDEATSALDPETETQILCNLRKKKPDTCIIVISHRPGIKEYATSILELARQ